MTDRKDTWQPIGALVAEDLDRIRGKRNAAFEANLGEATETYHRRLVEAEIEQDGVAK